MKKFAKMYSILCILATISFILESCGTIFQGTKEQVNFDSGPGAAEVWVNGAMVGTTPCQVQLKRKEEYTIEFKKKGYETKSYHISNSVGAGWVILDILGGLIPVVIDAATGGWHSLDQTTINATLQEQQSDSK